MCRCSAWLLAAALLSPSFALAQAPSAATAAQGAPQLPDFKLPPGATDPSPTGPLHTCHYPTALARQHVSGTDIVGVKVGTAGTVEDSVIVQSSGSPQLDSAAQLCVKAWLYKPAMRDGQPIEAWLQALINWHLLRRGQAPPALPANVVSPPLRKPRVSDCEWWHLRETSGVLVVFSVEPDGTVKNPAILKGSGAPKVDKDALDCVAQRLYRPAMQNGQPVEVRLTDWMF